LALECHAAKPQINAGRNEFCLRAALPRRHARATTQRRRTTKTLRNCVLPVYDDGIEGREVQ
jgi:hypothetical protein